MLLKHSNWGRDLPLSVPAEHKPSSVNASFHPPSPVSFSADGSWRPASPGGWWRPHPAPPRPRPPSGRCSRPPDCGTGSATCSWSPSSPRAPPHSASRPAAASSAAGSASWCAGAAARSPCSGGRSGSGNLRRFWSWRKYWNTATINQINSALTACPPGRARSWPRGIASACAAPVSATRRTCNWVLPPGLQC